MAGADDEAKRNQSAAIDALLERHLPALRAFVRPRVGGALSQQEASSDLVQSVCRKILTGRERIVDRGDAAFKGWRFTTALRKIDDKRRRWSAEKRDLKKRTDPGESADDAAALLDQYATLATRGREASLAEQVKQVEATMQALSEEQGAIVTLHKIAGLSHAEIGKQLGRSEENCRQMLRRALVKLAEELDDA